MTYHETTPYKHYGVHKEEKTENSESLCIEIIAENPPNL